MKVVFSLILFGYGVSVLFRKNQDTEQSLRGDGGSVNYYELPKGATELRHLIRYKKMSHSIGEIFCAIYRLNDNGEYLRNLKKAKFYIDSEIEEYEKENKWNQ